MKFIFSFILVTLVFGFFVSIAFTLGNSKLKERVFDLVMAVVMLLCVFATVCFKAYMGI